MATQHEDSSTSSIHPATRVGPAALAVADLERSLAFYTGALGFALLGREGGRAVLGAGGVPLLVLEEQTGARPFPGYGATGLYHFAILAPTRADLGRWLQHWLDQGYPLPGQGDHLVSEALYLSDPDGNGIEIYRDRPREDGDWAGGQVRMATDPVDIAGVLEEAARAGEPWNGLTAGTRLGHMHLQVGDITAAEHFYHDVLGFDVTAKLPGALFVSAGGYHHHVGLNTWQSRGAPPAPQGTAGLRYYVLELPDEAARASVLARLDAADVPHVQIAGGDVVVRDPWQNVIVLHAGAPQAELSAWPAYEALA